MSVIRCERMCVFDGDDLNKRCVHSDCSVVEEELAMQPGFRFEISVRPECCIAYTTGDTLVVAPLSRHLALVDATSSIRISYIGSCDAMQKALAPCFDRKPGRMVQAHIAREGHAPLAHFMEITCKESPVTVGGSADNYILRWRNDFCKSAAIAFTRPSR